MIDHVSGDEDIHFKEFEPDREEDEGGYSYQGDEGAQDENFMGYGVGAEAIDGGQTE